MRKSGGLLRAWCYVSGTLRMAFGSSIKNSHRAWRDRSQARWTNGTRFRKETQDRKSEYNTTLRRGQLTGVAVPCSACPVLPWAVRGGIGSQRRARTLKIDSAKWPVIVLGHFGSLQRGDGNGGQSRLASLAWYSPEFPRSSDLIENDLILFRRSGEVTQ